MKTLFALSIALPLMLAACADAEAPEDADVQDPAALDEAPEEKAALDLSGQWQVIAHNNIKIGSVYAAIASFGEDDVMTVNSDCLTMRFQLNRDGNMVEPQHLGTTQCGRPQTDGELMIEEVVPQANIIAESQGELMMSGPGGTLRLVRPGSV
ncbi:hypothetical protein [Sphingomicrobium arenosum]|uniref:hypothetical protein n=1 Tax=Sphingomicrobium arenosum TaxID=2233861 RepID=UPI002241028D|nr:hypothetical protein [Sphingomicrobium arenosum]